MGNRRDWRTVRDPVSTQPDPPKEPGDATLINDSPVYHREHSTAIGYDPSTLNNASLVKPREGVHDVVVHGNDQGYFEPGAVNAYGNSISTGEVHPGHIADAVRGNPNYKGEPVRLISCYSGTVAPDSEDIPAGQMLANALKVPVMAPTDMVGVRTLDGPGQEPKLYGDGRWAWFTPKENE